MPYSRLTMAQIIETFGVDRKTNPNLFKEIKPRKISKKLSQSLIEQHPLAVNIGSEKACSELLIMPVFFELYQQAEERIRLFSGVELNVDKSKGLNGVVDFLVSFGGSYSVITAPIVAVAEAKQDKFDKGAAQCIAEMIAAKIFNQCHGREMEVFGVITNGTIWQFARFANEKIVEISGDYSISDPEESWGFSGL
jgi:hypothetical protein